MAETTNPTLGSGSLPGNYQEVLYWRIAEKPLRFVLLQVLGGVLLVVFGFVFSRLAVNLGNLPSPGDFTLRKMSSEIASSIIHEKLPARGAYELSEIVCELGVFLVAIGLTLVFHELTHGMFMRMYGAKPKYGILMGGLMFYATSPGYAFHRTNYIVLALAPFVGISILVVLAMWALQGTMWVALLGICGTINASGAIGDFWITSKVLRYASTARIMDERDGFRVFLPNS